MNSSLLVWLYVSVLSKGFCEAVCYFRPLSEEAGHASEPFFSSPASCPLPVSHHPDQLIDTCAAWHWEPAYSLIHEIQPSLKSLSANDTHADTRVDSALTHAELRAEPRRHLAHPSDDDKSHADRDRQGEEDRERDGEGQQEHTRVKAVTICCYRLKSLTGYKRRVCNLAHINKVNTLKRYNSFSTQYIWTLKMRYEKLTSKQQISLVLSPHRRLMEWLPRPVLQY